MTLEMFRHEARGTKKGAEDEEAAPHSLDEKLAIRESSRDTAPRRSRKSILSARFSRPVDWREGRRVLLLDTGLSKSFWACTSDAEQEKPGTMFEKIEPTPAELEQWK